MVNYFFLLPNFLNIGTETGKSDHFFFHGTNQNKELKYKLTKSV